MTFEDFKQQAPDAAATFERVCFGSDDQLVKLGVLSAPRASLHSPTLWTYEKDGDTWRCTGEWGEIWELRDGKWFCEQERPFRHHP